MIQWLLKTRFRIALVFLFFFVIFSIGFSRMKIDVENKPQHTTIGESSAIVSQINSLDGAVAFIGMCGTLSTVILTWRADRRATKESDLKTQQMQQQIAELQMKLNSSSNEENKFPKQIG
jgi:hypothetical protein